MSEREVSGGVEESACTAATAAATVAVAAAVEEEAESAVALGVVEVFPPGFTDCIVGDGDKEAVAGDAARGSQRGNTGGEEDE